MTDEHSQGLLCRHYWHFYPQHHGCYPPPCPQHRWWADGNDAQCTIIIPNVDDSTNYDWRWSVPQSSISMPTQQVSVFFPTAPALMTMVSTTITSVDDGMLGCTIYNAMTRMRTVKKWQGWQEVRWGVQWWWHSGPHPHNSHCWVSPSMHASSTSMTHVQIW